MTLRNDLQIETYRRMHRIRAFEKAVEKLINEGEVPGPAHSSIGQEGAIVGACMALRDQDYIAGTHRSHGHPIGKGADVKPLLAEILGKATGVCKGRGGSMHLADSKVGSIGESAIIGGGIPIAAGAALSAQVRGTDQVALSFFGDGAANAGVLAETMNMAAVWKLPVIFFCENNMYAATTPAKDSHGQPDVAKRAAGYGMPGVIVDGQDVDAVYDAVTTATLRARRGDGPTLIEAKTYRFDEHCIGLFIKGSYRPKEEIELYQTTRDPIALYKTKLLAAGRTEAELAEVEAEVKQTLTEAMKFAKDSPFPAAASLYDNMYSNPIHYPA
jgi:TPP-dependent pyruvate/acetoin dehydrogenase alpha subunit